MLGPERGALVNEMSALIKVTPQNAPVPWPCEVRARRHCLNQKTDLPRHPTCWHLDPKPPNPRGKLSVVYTHPDLWHFVIAA